MFLRIQVATAVAALGCAAAAGADPGSRPAEPAGTYMVSVVKQKLANQYYLAWQSLYPRHQAVANLEAYVGCESLVPDMGALVGIKVLRVFDERIRISGGQRKVPTRAVRLRVAIAAPSFPQFPVVVDQTFHAVAVNGQ